MHWRLGRLRQVSRRRLGLLGVVAKVTLATVMQVGGRSSGRREAQAAKTEALCEKTVRNELQFLLRDWATPNLVL
ncbi:hypothetical protein BGZ57DRAFT_907774 [Hyaloscypha finlandica]|nr:hypothetical protein BGZ57DRAFT_907774 [Hyaloscypha finlandica]